MEYSERVKDVHPSSLLPHGDAFLFVDEVHNVDIGKRFVETSRRIPLNEPWTEAHFPNKPIYPGVLILEGMSQTCGILVRLLMDEKIRHRSIKHFGMLVEVNSARFRHTVEPGSLLIYQAEQKLKVGILHRFIARALVGGVIVADAVISISVGVIGDK